MRQVGAKGNGPSSRASRKEGSYAFSNFFAEFQWKERGDKKPGNVRLRLVLTSFPGGDKLGRESPKGGQHAKGTADLYQGIQTGSGTISALEWKIPDASGCIGYFRHPFEKLTAWSFTILLFFFVM